jgi:hypothetical protein
MGAIGVLVMAVAISQSAPSAAVTDTPEASIRAVVDGILKPQLMEIFVRRTGRWWVEAYHNVDVKTAS